MTLNRNVAVNAAKDEIDVSYPFVGRKPANESRERRVAAPWSCGVRPIEIALSLCPGPKGHERLETT